MTLTERLDARWPDRGPWRGGPVIPGGPAIALGRDVAALAWGAARLARERAGMARAAGHPWLPRVLDADDGVLLVAPFGDEVEVAPPLDGPLVRRRGSRAALLAELAPDVRWSRALGKLGARRRDADRWLGGDIEAASRGGPGLGGIHGALVRDGERGPLALRWDLAVAEGWAALDVAGLELAGEGGVAAHREAVGEGADAALELARAIVWAREARHGDEEARSALVELVRSGPPPSEVRVWIEGPAWLPPDLWEPPGATVDAARARWLVGTLDGASVGGQPLRVRCEPSVRARRRGPARAPRAVRRRRLFSRWDEGIQVDDEGLYSATPEALARRIAAGARGVVLDATCGVGALAIACAREPGVERVIAVDLDADRLRMARHNAGIYGVADRIRFVHGDALEVVSTVEADRLIVDPPWGGRDYDRDAMTLADLGMDVGELLARFSGPVALKLPRSFDPTTLPGEGWSIEPLVVERGVLKMLLARRPS